MGGLDASSQFPEFLAGSRVPFEVRASDEDPETWGTRRRYSSCGSPLVPPVATTASGDLRTPWEQERQKHLRREHTSRKGQEGQEKKEEKERRSKGTFLRDVAFAGHHAYVTLREGHVRAYNTIRGVIPPSPLEHLFSFTVTAIVPVVMNFVPRSSFAIFSIGVLSKAMSFLNCTRVHIFKS